MKAYSVDLRRKIVETYEAGGITQRELAKRFVVSLSFVITLLRRWREEKTLEARRRGGTQKPFLTPAIMQFLEAELERECDLSLIQLCQDVASRFSVQVSPKTMSRMLVREGLRRKKSAKPPAKENRRGLLPPEMIGGAPNSRS